MTRPTSEQIKALRKGDVVTVRAVVGCPHPDDDGDILLMIGMGQNVNAPRFVHTSQITTIEPRGIAAGDRVVRGSSQGVVRHVEGGRAAIMLDGDGLWTYPVSDLEIIP